MFFATFTLFPSWTEAWIKSLCYILFAADSYYSLILRLLFLFNNRRTLNNRILTSGNYLWGFCRLVNFWILFGSHFADNVSHLKFLLENFGGLIVNVSEFYKLQVTALSVFFCEVLNCQEKYYTYAHSFFGNPNIPEEIAGIATDAQP